MGIYMGDLILGVILQYMVSASFSCFLWLVKGVKLFPIGCIGLKYMYQKLIDCRLVNARPKQGEGLR